MSVFVVLNKKILIYFVFILGIQSCKDARHELLTNVTGKSGEILLVIDKNLGTTEPGHELKNILTRLQPALPQDEPMFRVYSIPHSSFGSFFQGNRNIILVKNCNPADSASVSARYDVWAKTQAYVEISSPDKDELVRIIKANGELIPEFFRTAERKRLQQTYLQFQEREIAGRLKARHNINLVIPKGYKLDVDSTDFAWISSETPATSQGILIYKYNYTDTNTFTAEYLTDKRDSFLRKYVPGPLKDTWMTTEHDFTPIATEYNLNNLYAFELRGLWKVQNDFMGGPFINITVLDEKRNTVITVEGYVYAPKYDKIEYIRQMEAILYTLTLN